MGSTFSYPIKRLNQIGKVGFSNVLISPQPAFEMLSDSWNWYLQYKTINKFTSW